MIDFYTMFRVPTADEPGVNLKNALSVRIAVYIRCACNLSAMMLKSGMKLTLLTNDRKTVLESAAPAGTMRIVEMDFDRDVPKGVAFRSAHFKLDVIKALGTDMFGPRSSLIDLDMLLVNPPNLSQVGGPGIVAYDISDEMVADIGASRLLSDMNQLTTVPQKRPRWFGGEFIMGSRSDFAELSKEIEKIWPIYSSKIGTFAHNADETVVTAALLNLADHGKEIRDAGEMKLVHRWWSARTLNRQLHLRDLSEVCFLHLPADKEFLAYLRDPALADVLSEYKKYVRPRLRKRRLVNPVLNLARGEKKFVGSL